MRLFKITTPSSSVVREVYFLFFDLCDFLGGVGWGGVLLLLIVKHVPHRGARNGLAAGSMPSCVFAVAGMASGPEEDESSVELS